MSDGSSIEWCDATWTIAVGCTRVSSGCDHCYAATFVHRGLHETHRGLTKLRPKDASRPGVDWNGTVRTLPVRLADPLRWRKPRRVFVGSMTDLFHPAIPFEYVAAVFGVMAACPQHTFLVLTKRPQRAREFFAWLDASAGPKDEQYGRQYDELDVCADAAARAEREMVGDPWMISERLSERRLPWPLPNVHLGTSVEDQATADERIPALLQCPAALHWVSAEPLLGPVDFGAIVPRYPDNGAHLSWVVVGGESGPGARPFHVEWARSIVRQGREAETPVFVKQLGAKPFDQIGPVRRDFPELDSKGGDIERWPADLRCRELPR
ncbi:MAG TPA: DUF5131 family protein [Candidatus Limnocylindria bacterium]|nr:DUF5131 family protein [Candidatus Limnocylindria bacterium]